jgi:hypothetical protein
MPNLKRYRLKLKGQSKKGKTKSKNIERPSMNRAIEKLVAKNKKQSFLRKKYAKNSL